MKANYQDKLNPKSDVSLGTLYDMNKQLMEKEPDLTQEELQLTKENLRSWFTHNFKEKYFMLLCHELRDYTLFNLDKTSTWAIANPSTIMQTANDVLECMTNRGDIIRINQEGDNVWELWIRNRDGCFAYYLFPYANAVIEY